MWAMDANAAPLVWNWNANYTYYDSNNNPVSGSDNGTFVTDGTNYSAGHYTISDFTVGHSDEGATIGSLSGGQYTTSDIYSFDWSGSVVTDTYSGYNGPASYMVFGQAFPLAGGYFFGGSYSPSDFAGISFPGTNYGAVFGSYTLTPNLSVSAVPLPPAVLLFAPALLGFMGLRRKSKLAATA